MDADKKAKNKRKHKDGKDKDGGDKELLEELLGRKPPGPKPPEKKKKKKKKKKKSKKGEVRGQRWRLVLEFGVQLASLTLRRFHNFCSGLRQGDWPISKPGCAPAEGEGHRFGARAGELESSHAPPTGEDQRVVVCRLPAGGEGRPTGGQGRLVSSERSSLSRPVERLVDYHSGERVPARRTATRKIPPRQRQQTEETKGKRKRQEGKRKMEVVRPRGLGAAGGATSREGPLPRRFCLRRGLSRTTTLGFISVSMVEFARGCASRSETKELME